MARRIMSVVMLFTLVFGVVAPTVSAQTVSTITAAERTLLLQQIQVLLQLIQKLQVQLVAKQAAEQTVSAPKSTLSPNMVIDALQFARVNAEQYYNENDFTYKNLCASEKFTNMQKRMNNIVTCNDSSSHYLVSVPLSGMTRSWCIDSTGYSNYVENIPASATACAAFAPVKTWVPSEVPNATATVDLSVLAQSTVQLSGTLTPPSSCSVGHFEFELEVLGNETKTFSFDDCKSKEISEVIILKPYYGKVPVTVRLHYVDTANNVWAYKELKKFIVDVSNPFNMNIEDATGQGEKG